MTRCLYLCQCQSKSIDPYPSIYLLFIPVSIYLSIYLYLSILYTDTYRYIDTYIHRSFFLCISISIYLYIERERDYRYTSQPSASQISQRQRGGRSAMSEYVDPLYRIYPYIYYLYMSHTSWPSQDIRLVRGLCTRLNTCIRKHPPLVCPPPRSSPTLSRNKVFPPDHPVLQYMRYNIGNGNIL